MQGAREVTTARPVSLDVVERLQEAHAQLRQLLQLCQGVARGNATSSSAAVAAAAFERLDRALPLHDADEDASIAPRLKGRLRALDEALGRQRLQHEVLQAPVARLRLVMRVIARDVTRLHALRFEVEAATSALSGLLDEHFAFEESVVFPALKRLLFADELEALALEMDARRRSVAA